MIQTLHEQNTGNRQWKLYRHATIEKNVFIDVLYTGYLHKNISFGDIFYFEPMNVQHKKLVSGVIDHFKVLLVDRDGNEILSNFKTSIVLHIV